MLGTKSKRRGSCKHYSNSNTAYQHVSFESMLIEKTMKIRGASIAIGQENLFYGRQALIRKLHTHQRTPVSSHQVESIPAGRIRLRSDRRLGSYSSQAQFHTLFSSPIQRPSWRTMSTTPFQDTKREPKRFAPLDPAAQHGKDLPRLKGIIFDVDGTLW